MSTFRDDHRLETFRSLITYGVEGLRTCALINGGAIVAILAYLGENASKPGFVAGIAPGLLCFVIGLSLAALAFVTAYATQLRLFNEPDRPLKWYHRHEAWLYPTIGLGIASVVLFLVGSIMGVASLVRG